MRTRIGVIDLERRVPASPAAPFHSAMRCLDLVQSTLRIAFPLDQGGGRHSSIPATLRGIIRLKRPRQNKIALDCKLPSEPGGHEAHSGVIREAQELVEIGLEGTLGFVGVEGAFRVSVLVHACAPSMAQSQSAPSGGRIAPAASGPCLTLPHVDDRHTGSRKVSDVPGDHRIAVMQRRCRDETIDHAENSSPPLDERRQTPPNRGDRRVDRKEALRIGRAERRQPAGKRAPLPARPQPEELWVAVFAKCFEGRASQHL